MVRFQNALEARGFPPSNLCLGGSTVSLFFLCAHCVFAQEPTLTLQLTKESNDEQLTFTTAHQNHQAAAAQALPRANSVAQPAEAPLNLSKDVIKTAVQSVSNDVGSNQRFDLTQNVLGAKTEQQRKLDAAFARAEVGSCLTPDAYKLNSSSIGPVGFAGLLAMPWLFHAMFTGTCSFNK